MISKGKAYLKIQELVVCFDEQIDSYKQTDYNEILTKRDFIDPLFKALDGTWIIHKDMQKLIGKSFTKTRLKYEKRHKLLIIHSGCPVGKGYFLSKQKKLILTSKIISRLLTKSDVTVGV